MNTMVLVVCVALLILLPIAAFYAVYCYQMWHTTAAYYEFTRDDCEKVTNMHVQLYYLHKSWLGTLALAVLFLTLAVILAFVTIVF